MDIRTEARMDGENFSLLYMLFSIISHPQLFLLTKLQGSLIFPLTPVSFFFFFFRFKMECRLPAYLIPSA